MTFYKIENLIGDDYIKSVASAICEPNFNVFDTCKIFVSPEDIHIKIHPEFIASMQAFEPRLTKVFNKPTKFYGLEFDTNNI